MGGKPELMMRTLTALGFVMCFFGQPHTACLSPERGTLSPLHREPQVGLSRRGWG